MAQVLAQNIVGQNDIGKEHDQLDSIYSHGIDAFKEVSPSSEFTSDEDVKILVVDDEAINLQVLVNQLSLQNYKVYTASNGQEALEIINSNNKFDLVLLDVMMPKMSGFEVCNTLRSMYSLFDLPVLMLTAKAQSLDIVTGFDSGANDYVLKPFDKRELLARTKTLLSLKQAVKQTIAKTKELESEKKQRLLAENLRSLSNSLGSTLELNEVLARLLQSTKNVVEFDYAVIILKNEDKITVSASYGDTDITDIQKLYNILTESYTINQDNMLNKNSKSHIRVPLIFKSEIIGAILIESNIVDQYGEHQALILSTFASQAVIAIENARLFGEVKKLATIDGLTGLYNRRYFFELGEREVSAAKRYNRTISCMMLDIDHFKRFNDKYGHDVGDLVLKTIASTLQKTLRDVDIPGRYGGEEFAIILPSTTIDGAKVSAERIRKAIESMEIFTEKHGMLNATVSIGVFGTSNVETNAKTQGILSINNLGDLLKAADEMLYKAKESGRNQVCFE